MIEPLFGDRCILCGRPVRKPGERLCIYHDIQFLIAQGAERMRERVGRKRAAVISNLPKKIQINKGA